MNIGKNWQGERKNGKVVCRLFVDASPIVSNPMVYPENGKEYQMLKSNIL